ncbi:MAG: hypothetical protein RPR97_10680 [Colwellia sp.]
MTSTKKLVLIELNEINFDIVQKYLDQHPSQFNNLRRLISLKHCTTYAEEQYELLEPWIQWVSVHTGKSYSEHNVFRLGDIINTSERQLFEKIEGRGYKVGAISPLNASNQLQKADYFIGDPWTETSPSGNMLIHALQKAISQSVNDNSEGTITLKSIVTLLVGFTRLAQFKNLPQYFGLALSSRGKPWRKALFLDLLLSDIHSCLFKNSKTNFSTLFLNAGAHIQHHYLFNSKVLSEHKGKNPLWYVNSKDDPCQEMLKCYDSIIGNCLDMVTKGTELIIATGLSQIPYDSIKYYYRLRCHDEFLKLIGCHYIKVVPRMTRDFLILFESPSDAENALKILSSVCLSNEPIFGEIDNRGDSLFVTLNYPHEIRPESEFMVNSESKGELLPHVIFIAIKNGMHQSKGFAYFSLGLEAPAEGKHVKNIYNTISSYFS